MIAAMRSTPASFRTSWIGVRRRLSKPVSRKPWTGTSPTNRGASACSTAAIVWSAWGHEGWGHEHDAERHYPRRWLWHPAVSDHPISEQATVAGVRQANDLLPAGHVDAGRHPPGPDDQYAA